MNQPRRKLPLKQRILSFFKQHIRQALASLGELWRTPVTSLMTMLVMGFSLALPALLLALTNNASKVEAQWQSAAEISLFIKLEVKESRRASLVARIKGMSEVLKVDVLDPDQALAEFKQSSEFGDALKYLDSNPLPAVIRVTPTPPNTDAEKARNLKDKLAQNTEVALARLDLDWLERLKALAEVSKQAGLALATLLLVALVLITGNTIRLAINQHFHEIKVMKLVGATDAFIRRPFLYGGFWLGVLAGLVALVLVNVMLLWLDGAVAQLVSLYSSQVRLDGLSSGQSFGLMFTSCFLSWLGAWLSVRRHLNAIEPG